MVQDLPGLEFDRFEKRLNALDLVRWESLEQAIMDILGTEDRGTALHFARLLEMRGRPNGLDGTGVSYICNWFMNCARPCPQPPSRKGLRGRVGVIPGGRRSLSWERDGNPGHAAAQPHWTCATKTDLTDAAWALIEPLLPESLTHGRPRAWSLREIMNAIFSVLRGGIAWRLLPTDLPPKSTALSLVAL